MGQAWSHALTRHFEFSALWRLTRKTPGLTFKDIFGGPMFKLLIPVIVLILGGCATARSIQGPDGTQHQMISCPSVEQCYEKATEVCGGKYKIVNTSTDTSGGGQLMVDTTTKMLVKCDR